MTKCSSPPDWLNNSYFERALRAGENDSNITVISTETKIATASGDNYLSDIIGAKVKITRNGQLEHRSLIVKCSLALEEEMRKFMEKGNIFNREINMYSAIFPEMDRLLKKAYPQDFQPIAAKLYYSNTDARVLTIVFDDLKAQGFKLAERTIGLDLKHCLLVMRKIAQYHAATLAIHKENKQLLEPVKEFRGSDNNNFETFFNKNLMNCIKEVEKWPDYKIRFADKLKQIAETAFDSFKNSMKGDDDGFNVLLHGDMWANNMMFKYAEETGEVEDVRFVDFQVSRWASPAVDLHYFLNSSAVPEVLESIQVLIKEYYDKLEQTLKLMGYEELTPTLSQINEEIEKAKIYGIMAAITIRAFAFPDKENVPDANIILSKRDGPHFSEEYKESIRRLLPVYETIGWI